MATINPNCCPDDWWCVGGMPAAYPVGTRPDSYSGGPSRSYEAALTACPATPVLLTCSSEDCETPIALTDPTVLQISDQTGSMDMPNSVDLTSNETAFCAPGDGNFGLGMALISGSGRFRVQLCVECNSVPSLVRFQCYYALNGAMAQIGSYNTLGDGWVSDGAGSWSFNMHKNLACGEQLADVEYLGNFNFYDSTGITFIGTADLYLIQQ